MVEKQQGFTLIEMMIVIALIGILATLAIPSYQNYTRRAHYAEVVAAAAPYKTAVAECFNNSNNLINCNAGSNGVPANLIGGSSAGMVASVAVVGGQITVTPNAKYGIVSEDTYILKPIVQTPTSGSSYLTWSASGGGVSKGYAKENP